MSFRSVGRRWLGAIGLVSVVVSLPSSLSAQALPAGTDARTKVVAATTGTTPRPATDTAGTIIETAPTRVLDTRIDLGIAGALPGGATRTLTLAGRAGVPADAAAVLLNLTVTNARAGGHVTAYPASGSVPTASSINFAAGDTIANLTLVRLANGSIRLHNGSSKPVDLVADVAGYVVGGGLASLDGSTVPTAPARILDTRIGLGAPRSVPARSSIALQVRGRGSVPASGVAAVVLNVTAVKPVTGGHVTAWPSGEPRPGTSNINLTSGRTIAGLVTVALGDDGKVRLHNATNGALPLAADVVGWVRAGEAEVSGTVVTTSPLRALDTRTRGRAVAPGAEVRFDVPQLLGLPEGGVAAAVLTVTATAPTRSGYVTAYPGGVLPNASTLNFAAGQTIANSAVVKVGPGSQVVLRNRSAGTVHLIADLAGVVLADPLSVAAGSSHSCAVTPRGGVRCWGNSTFGGLGDGLTATLLRSTPRTVIGLEEPVQKVVAGDRFSCGLTVTGAVWCWGYNLDGQLGTGDTSNSGTPRQVYPAGHGVLDIAAGHAHACAVLDGFGVTCWGRGNYGALGSSGSSTTPKTVPGVAAVAVEAGSDFTCASTTTAGVSCWGRNDQGQVGSAFSSTMPPTVVPDLTDPSSLTLGTTHACLLDGDTVLCWGSNAQGQAGRWLGTSVVRGPQPVLSAGTDRTWVEAGAGTTCAGGPTTASCWGQNPYGITGTDQETSPEKPRSTPWLVGTGQVELGSKHACLVRLHGSVACWGQSDAGQLGDGLEVGQRTGVPVSGLDSGVTALSSGPMHRCAIRGGDVVCWGRNVDGELGDGAPTAFPSGTPALPVPLPRPAVAVVAGGTWGPWGYSCSALDDGTVRCWGANANGVLGDGTTTSSTSPVTVEGLSGSAVALTAGSSAACALLADAAVQCWGGGGQVGSAVVTLGRPATVALGGPATTVSAGDQHACAVRSDQSVWCWGTNTTGQLGDGTTTGRSLPGKVLGLPAATDVSAGSGHTCAVVVDGSVWCWGSTNNGQVGTGTASTAPILSPVRVDSLTVAATSVSADAEQTCALDASGTARCWGYNYWGQTGTGDPSTRVLTPKPVTLPATGITTLDGGWWNGCALDRDGAVTCWGARRWWLGDGTSSFATEPRRVVGL